MAAQPSCPTLFDALHPSGDLLDAATVGLQKFRRFAKHVNKLSTTQKIIGGLAVLAAGYALITNTTPGEAPTETAALDESAPTKALLTTNPSAPSRTPKSRRTKPGSHAKHVPFSEEHS